MGSPRNAEQLMIALEPEAAAIFCQGKNMSDFYSESGGRSVDGILAQHNTHYMVVDIGGNYYRILVSIHVYVDLSLLN